MVKLILPNSGPPGQESQKCMENSATDLVTSRKKIKSFRHLAVGLRHLAVGLRHLAVGLRHLAVGLHHLAQAQGDQVRGTIFETFLALLARRSRVGQNEFHHRFCL